MSRTVKHAGRTQLLLQEFSLGEPIAATFVAISDQSGDHCTAFDDDLWRGGSAAIGTVELRS